MLSGLIEVYLPQGFVGTQNTPASLVEWCAAACFWACRAHLRVRIGSGGTPTAGQGAPPHGLCLFAGNNRGKSHGSVHHLDSLSAQTLYVVLLRAGASLLVAALMTAWIVRRTPRLGFLATTTCGSKNPLPWRSLPTGCSGYPNNALSFGANQTPRSVTYC